MNTKTRLTLALTALAFLLAGWLAGGTRNVVEAQSLDRLEDALLEGYERRMFSGNVAGTGGTGSGATEFAVGRVGDSVDAKTWLYNTKAGKVYRVWERCGGDNGSNGCLWAVPVFRRDRLGIRTPSTWVRFRGAWLLRRASAPLPPPLAWHSGCIGRDWQRARMALAS